MLSGSRFLGLLAFVMLLSLNSHATLSIKNISLWMNLLIVGRKSKTQMRNMFYWAGIISILICLPLRVSAQSYEQMWKQVEVLEQKQLPKSAIQELRKIYEYAKQEKN